MGRRKDRRVHWQDEPQLAAAEALPWAQQITTGPGIVRWRTVAVEVGQECPAYARDVVESLAGGGQTSGRADVLEVRLRLATDFDERLKPEGYRLSVDADEPRLEVVGADPAGARHCALAAAALVRAGRATGLTPVEVHDWPAIARRGYMECFYGPAWTMPDRLLLMERAAAWGLNTYCYGPAADCHTGAKWDVPYPASQLSDLAVLARRGAELGVELVWRVSPSAPLAPHAGARLSATDHAAKLADKLGQLAAIGVRTFIVAFDDLSTGLVHPEDRATFVYDPHPVAAAQATFLNNARNRLPADVRIVCCPTLYWGNQDRGGYRRRLAKLLRPDIEVCWTGPAVVAGGIDGAGARSVAAQFSRDRLWLWDNYPVNDWDSEPVIDAVPESRRLLLGPIQARRADLAATLLAYSANCGSEAAAALPMLYTVAAWSWNPHRYDPLRAWHPAVDQAFTTHTSFDDLRTIVRCGRPDACATAFRRFAELHRMSPLAPDAQGWLRPAVAAFLDQRTGADPTGAGLTARLTEADALSATLLNCSSPTARAVRPWLHRLADEVAVARAAVGVIAATRNRAIVPDCAQRRLATPLRPAAPAAGGALTPLIEHARTVGGPAAPALDFLGEDTEPAASTAQSSAQSEPGEMDIECAGRRAGKERDGRAQTQEPA